MRPYPRDQVCVALIDSRGLLAQLLPAVVGVFLVLDRVIAEHLVFGATVRRADIAALELRDRVATLDTERQADEATRRGIRIRPRGARDVDLDDAVVEFRAREDRHDRVVVLRLTRQRAQVDGTPALPGHHL